MSDNLLTVKAYTYINEYKQVWDYYEITEEDLLKNYCIWDGNLFSKSSMEKNNVKPEIENITLYDIINHESFLWDEVGGYTTKRFNEVYQNEFVKPREEAKQKAEEAKQKAEEAKQKAEEEVKIEFRVNTLEKVNGTTYRSYQTYQMTESEIIERCCYYVKNWGNILYFKEDVKRKRNKRDLTPEDIQKEISKYNDRSI